MTIKFRAICQTCKVEFPIVDSYTGQREVYWHTNSVSTDAARAAERAEVAELKRSTIIVRERTTRIPWAEVRCPKCGEFESYCEKLQYDPS